MIDKLISNINNNINDNTGKITCTLIHPSQLGNITSYILKTISATEKDSFYNSIRTMIWKSDLKKILCGFNRAFETEENK